MSELSEGDYVLGTGSEELERLGLQHRVWRSCVLDLWQRTGIGAGSRVLDVGAGPGFATVDLAEIVGPSGLVVAVERSPQFVAAARAACRLRGLNQVQVHQIDLMTDPIPASGMDAVWCRWVALFVSSPEVLVQKIAEAVRPGGVAIFHEYVQYTTLQLIPARKHFDEFIQQVMASWRDTGGDPDVARNLPPLLTDAGFTIRSAVPRILSTRPGDYVWQWPSSFVDINLDRLLELGRVTKDWTEAVRRDFAAADADPETVMLTPMVLEIVAERIR